MSTEHIHEQKLRALPVQLIEISDGIVLRRGRSQIKIAGLGATEAVCTLLNSTSQGSTTREKLRNSFAAPDRLSVDYLIQELLNRRILVPSDTAELSPVRDESSLDVFYWHLGKVAQKCNQLLNNKQIVILGVNCVSRQLATSLISSGAVNVEIVNCPLLCNLRLFDDTGTLTASEWPNSLKPPLEYKEWAARVEGGTIGCLVATSDFGGLELMRQWNLFCIQKKCHFLPIVLQDLVGTVGPLVIPGETPCFECLRARENSNMTEPSSRRVVESTAFEGQAVAGFHPSMASILGDIAAIELHKFYAGWMLPQVVGTLIEVNLLSMYLITHRVLKVPRCPVCSTLNTHATISLAKERVESFDGEQR